MSHLHYDSIAGSKFRNHCVPMLPILILLQNNVTKTGKQITVPWKQKRLEHSHTHTHGAVNPGGPHTQPTTLQRDAKCTDPSFPLSDLFFLRSPKKQNPNIRPLFK